MKSTCSIFLFVTIICTHTCRVQSVDESGIWPQDLGHQLRLRSDDQWPQDLTHQLRLRSDDQCQKQIPHSRQWVSVIHLLIPPGPSQKNLISLEFPSNSPMHNGSQNNAI